MAVTRGRGAFQHPTMARKAAPACRGTPPRHRQGIPSLGILCALGYVLISWQEPVPGPTLAPWLRGAYDCPLLTTAKSHGVPQFGPQ